MIARQASPIRAGGNVDAAATARHHGVGRLRSSPGAGDTFARRANRWGRQARYPDESGRAVGASRYSGDDVPVGLRGGSKPEDGGVPVGFDVTGRLKLQAGAGVDGGPTIGIGAEWEY